MSSQIRWPIVKLRDLASTKKNAMVGGPFGSNLVTSDYVEAGVPVIRGVNLPDEQRFNSNSFVFVTERKADSLKTNLASAGDLVFTQRGTLGQVGIIPSDTPYERLLISQSQMKMTVNSEKAYPLYIYYYFRLPSTVTYIENHALQSGVPHINLGILRNLEIPCPPLDIQEKIVGVLSTYDDLIENNKRRIALLEKLAEEIYREWFVRFRFPGHKTVEFAKGFPKDWRRIPIEKLCKEVRQSVKKKDLEDDSLYVGLEHIPRKSIALTSFGAAAEVDSDKLCFKAGDILFGKIRPYLHKVSLAHVSGACSTDTIVLRPKCKEVEGFILFTVYSERFIELATTASKGTKMPRADWSFLGKQEILIPPDDLLERYQSIFAKCFDQIKNLLVENQLLVGTKGLLLPRLISGKLSVEDLDVQFPPSMAEDNAA